MKHMANIANVKNTFIGMMNTIKEQFNKLSDTWIGQKAGLEPMQMFVIIMILICGAFGAVLFRQQRH